MSNNVSPDNSLMSPNQDSMLPNQDSMLPNQKRVFNIMKYLKTTNNELVMDMKRLNNIGNFYNDVHKFTNNLNNTNNINAQHDGIFNDSNKAKHATLDNEIIKSLNSVNTTINDWFYNDVRKFTNDLNNTNDINAQHDDIFNDSNKAKHATLDNKIIKSLNGVNATINDWFYNDVHKFIDELNKTNNINAQLDGIFNDSNKAKLTKLDQEIIKSLNSTNGKIIDGFYNNVHKFIVELNNKNNINAQLDGIFNKSNTAKLTKLDQEIIDTFNNNIQKSTKWLQYYYDLEKELRRAMKPDPMIAYRIGNVPTFLPKIGIGDITNKIGEKYGNMIDGIKGINIPPLSNVMPSYVDYDALNIVFTESNDGKMVGEKKILDKGVTTQ